MQGNRASMRVLEKCGFVGRTQKTRDERQWRGTSPSSEEYNDKGDAEQQQEEEEELDIYGRRKLSRVQEDELKSAIGALNMRARPKIEQIRTTIDAAVPRPRKNGMLLPYRYERKDVK